MSSPCEGAGLGEASNKVEAHAHFQPIHSFLLRGMERHPFACIVLRGRERPQISDARPDSIYWLAPASS